MTTIEREPLGVTRGYISISNRIKLRFSRSLITPKLLRKGRKSKFLGLAKFIHVCEPLTTCFTTFTFRIHHKVKWCDYILNAQKYQIILTPVLLKKKVAANSNK